MRTIVTVLSQWLLLVGILLYTHSSTATASNVTAHQDAALLVEEHLTPLLSEGARISFHGTSGWDDLLGRASAPRVAPVYVAVVEVAIESDVQNVIKVANKLNLPFLAVSGSHGWTTSLNGVTLGIQINMRKLNNARLEDDGQSVTIGGGILQHELVPYLYEHGKQAVHGLCECVSAIGPLLGGGHSMLQSAHGFAADNLVSARVVLADGRLVTASDSENEGLFWALRGAGHNFGVVTSFELKVHDLPPDPWTMIVLAFSGHKLEAFLEVWNRLEEEYYDPGLVVLNGLVARNEALDAVDPVVNVQIFSQGKDTAADIYASAFRALGPIADSTTTDIPWVSLFKVGGMGLDAPVCRPNDNIVGFPNSLTRWDAPAIRAGYDLFAELTADPTFSTSGWLLESFGRKGVQDVEAGFNAVPVEEREYHLLAAPLLWWAGDDKGDRRKAEAFGVEIQRVSRGSGGSEVAHTYVNYAYGEESVPEVYGRDAERLARLRALKREWDPENRFGFYSPILDFVGMVDNAKDSWYDVGDEDGDGYMVIKSKF